MHDRAEFRRLPGACRYYREDWSVTDVLYRCYCLLEMPPVTAEEQARCMASARGCWRFAQDAAYTPRASSPAGVAE